ncbi:MAG: hypothetical protein Q9190_000585 [Brigantiaea leucoxantha]
MPGVIKRSRCQGEWLPHRDDRHYYADGAWIHPHELRQSCYSDFVPCSYSEASTLSRLYKYVRALLVQTNGSLLPRRLLCSAPGRDLDLEMISTSPSPTLHANLATSPSKTSYQSRSRNASYASSRLATSTPSSPYVKPPPPAALPRPPPKSPGPVPDASKHHHSTTASLAQSLVKTTIDAGTQYSPPSLGAPVLERQQISGRKRGTSEPRESPGIPAEPVLEPQMSSTQNRPSTSTAQSNTASSTTLGKESYGASDCSEGSSPKRARPAKPATKYMPEQYETCDVKDLVVLISNMLMELIRFNDDIPLRDGRLTRFHSRAPPTISVRDYLQRLTTHATLSPPILLSMVYYIDRLCALYPAFTISSLTVHRFLITSATVASKGLSDLFWTNNTYARVGGITLKELALLELEFLWRVEWRIVPKPEVLVDYYRSLVERSDEYEIRERSRSSGEHENGRASAVQQKDFDPSFGDSA